MPSIGSEAARMLAAVVLCCVNFVACEAAPPSAQPIASAESKATNDPSPHDPMKKVCAMNTGDEYKRAKRAREYADNVHEQRGWSGGSWMASGPSCMVLEIEMDGQTEEFKTSFVKGSNADLCSYGFVFVSFNDDLRPLDCGMPKKGHRAR